MDSLADTDVHPGEVLAGKFRIERVLGRGGMGVVVAATHLHLDEQVALKFLLPEALQNSEAVRRFEREARAAVKIKSEHVARVTDVGSLESGAPYMVMEFLHGMDLGQYLEKRGPLPLEEAVEYLLQAGEAIAEAHALGIVHRDLKPANLYRIIRSDGTPSIKVLDFGISKVSSGDEASLTQTSSMMGSPYYMSPEQMTSAKNVDQRTDVWALGVILHELLTGRVPYEGDTIPEVCSKVLQHPAPCLSSDGAFPPQVDAVFERALAKNREDRFDDVAQFSAALSPFAGADGQRSVERISKVLGVAHTMQAGRLTGAIRDSATNERTSATQHTTLDGAAHTQLDYTPPAQAKSNKLVLAAAAALLLVGGTTFAVMGSPKQSAEAELPVEQSERLPASGESEAASKKARAEEEQPDAEPTGESAEQKSSSQPAADADAAEKLKAAAEARATQQAKMATEAKAAQQAKAAAEAKAAAQAQAAEKARAAARAKAAAQQAKAAAPAVPRPAPRPAPTPAPNLYLDRR